MNDELAAILTGAPAPKPAAAKAPSGRATRTYDPIDAAVRTVLAEEADPVAQQWVAGVIANRLKSGKHGKDLYEVVTAKDQFEPWARGTAQSVDTNSKAYKEAYARVTPILRGEADDPSGGAMNFYAPEAQAELAKKDGRNPKAEFDDGTGVRVGKSLFFRPGGDASELASMFGDVNASDAAAKAKFKDLFGDPNRFEPGAELSGAGLIEYRDLKGDTLTSPQTDFYTALNKGGGYKPDEPGGSVSNPFFVQKGAREKDVPAGAYYVDRTGKFKRAPGGEGEAAGFMEGMSRGAGDVMLSMAQMAPGAQDSVIGNRLLTDQAIYDADHKGEFKAGAGRFLGQLSASVPFIAGGEAALAPIAARFAVPALAVDATVGARALDMARRGGTLAASGAAEGAAGAALVSSASDAPLEEQIAMGAMLGGALKPVAAGAETGMRRFFGPSTKGAAPGAAQEQLFMDAQGLPVPVSLDVGQVSRAPATTAAVDDMLRGSKGDLPAKVVQGFRAEQQTALRENVQAISDSIAGRPIQPGEGAKAVSDTLNVRMDAANKAINRTYDAARAKGEDAMLVSANELRTGIIDGLKRGFNESKIGSVLSEVESLGAEGAPTARQLYEARERLSGLTQSSDKIEARAARAARNGFDSYIKLALKNDLFLGDPAAINKWREAIKKRAEFGKLFEGDDLIEALTERTQRGGAAALKVDPEEAVNYILGRDNLGFATKKDLTRDLDRLKGVLGAKSPEWNGMRAEVFLRLARAGEGAPEAGVAQFSGQKFLKAWNDLNAKNPRLVAGMFTQDERELISKFGDVAQAATTSVKGGANTSNTAIAGKRMMDNIMQFLSIGGGAGGGAAVGGIPGAALGAAFGSLIKDMRELLAVRQARKMTYGAKPVVDNPRLENKLLTGPTAPVAGSIAGNRILSDRQPVLEPQ